jgi:hypothetical protein
MGDFTTGQFLNGGGRHFLAEVIRLTDEGGGKVKGRALKDAA